jgi:hypothetical protein
MANLFRSRVGRRVWEPYRHEDYFRRRWYWRYHRWRKTGHYLRWLEGLLAVVTLSPEDREILGREQERAQRDRERLARLLFSPQEA